MADDLDSLSALWPRVGPPRATYFAACHWPVPYHPMSACRWLVDQPNQYVFTGLGWPRAGVVIIHQLWVQARVARLFALDDAADPQQLVAMAEAGLARTFELGFDKCEWWVLASWPTARSAAAQAGFTQEVVAPAACLDGGEYSDLILFGMLRREWCGSESR